MVAPRGDTERIGEWHAGYQMPIPALIYAADKAIEVLERLGNEEALEEARRARKLCDVAADYEYDWEQQKEEDPYTRPEARELDHDIDNTLSQLLQTAEGYADLKRNSEPKELAEELVGELFPSGVYPITSQPYGRQYESVNTVLERLRGPFSRHVNVLNLDPIVSQLEELNEEFGEELDTVGDTITYDEVEAARVEARDAFDKFFAKVMYDYADDMEAFNRVIAGYQKQTERVRRSMQRHGKMPGFDQENGEPVGPEGEGESGQNDGGSGETETDGSPEETDTDGEQETSDSGDGTET